ncbi:MAG: DUF2017 family protein [Actinomycetia bacterium]|nr:DUF2017 family protein [Actinomycetes bacterium]
MFFVEGDVVTAVFTDDELMLLQQIPRLLDDTDTAVGDPGYEVLHRAVYRDDPGASRELDDLVASDRWVMRTSDRKIVERFGEGVTTMTRQEARGFLRSLNEARLVVAARAGVFDSGPGWEEMVPTNQSLAAVAWLGYVQAELIRVLTAE